MPVAKGAIEAFLNRDLTEFDFLKGEEPEELDAALGELDPPPDFHTEPFTHQKACFLVGCYVPEFLYFLSMGLGKTKILLDLFWWYRRAYGAERLLALVPNTSNIFTWEDEVRKHRPELTAIPMQGSTQERWDMIEQPGDVFIVNYQGFIYMVSQAREKKTKSGKANKVDPDLCDELASYFDMAAFDESQAFKNVQSLTYHACRRFAGKLDARFALTGTPFGRDPLDLWGQFYVIDRGKTLGPNKGIFRDSFFKSWQAPWGVQYRLDKKKEDLLHKVIKNRSIRFKAEECIDLPKQIFKVVPVEFPKSIAYYYDQARQAMKAGLRDRQTVELNFAKMRQLASGFLYYTEEDSEERTTIEFNDNPKMDALLELIDEMPDDSKMVVFHEYIQTGDLISRTLKKKKIKHERLYSGTKNHREVLRRFNEQKTNRVFAVNNASGAQGLNLQVANYVVFFESPVAPIIRQQAEKRCHRPGQEKPVWYYDLVMKDSMDERVMSYLSEGKNLMQAIIDGKETV